MKKSTFCASIIAPVCGRKIYNHREEAGGEHNDEGLGEHIQFLLSVAEQRENGGKRGHFTFFEKYNVPVSSLRQRAARTPQAARGPPVDYRDNPQHRVPNTQRGAFLRRLGGAFLLRLVVYFYSGVDT